MDEDEFDFMGLLQVWNLLLLLLAQFLFVRKWPVRRWWVRPLNLRRNENGRYATVFREISNTDHEEFATYCRMSVQAFDHLVNLVHPYIVKRSIRTPLPTGLRLACTLSFFAHGDSILNQKLAFRIGRSTAYKIVYETADALWKALQPTYLPACSKQRWEQIAEGFEEKCNFPNCIGAVDGKHIAIQAPPNSGSQFFNYKKFFSIVLMATCDAYNRFTWVDIGDYGHMSDGGVWRASEFGQTLAAGGGNLPDPRPLPGTENENPAINVPFAFVGDEAFPLQTYLMRPYPKVQLGDDERIFNYRLSRARRVIENTFGILVSRWSILRVPLCCNAANATTIVKALVCLHNFLMSNNVPGVEPERQYCPPGLIDRELPHGDYHPGAWRQEGHVLQGVGRLGGNRGPGPAVLQREHLKDYFTSDVGQVDWQWARAFRGFEINLPL